MEGKKKKLSKQKPRIQAFKKMNYSVSRKPGYESSPTAKSDGQIDWYYYWL